MATVAEIEAARAVMETFFESQNVTQSKARAQLILEAAERVRERQARYDQDAAMGRHI